MKPNDVYIVKWSGRRGMLVGTAAAEVSDSTGLYTRDDQATRSPAYCHGELLAASLILR